MRLIRLPLMAALFLLFAFLAEGHAILLTATPAAGQVVTSPDVDVSLRFNARVDAKRSGIRLVAPSGDPKALSLDEQAPPDALNAQIHGLASGTYTLQWQVLALDGHITRGEVSFRVQLKTE